MTEHRHAVRGGAYGLCPVSLLGPSTMGSEEHGAWLGREQACERLCELELLILVEEVEER